MNAESSLKSFELKGADLLPAPAWVRMAAGVIRRLPAGRYRIINLICRRPQTAFLMYMPEELGRHSFSCDLRDLISREVCFTGQYEPQETALVRAILRPGMSFVDVGANWGYFTLLAAHLVGRGGRVVSLEPDPRLFPILRSNVARNGLDQVTTLQVAAADKEATLKLAGYDEAGNNYGVSRVVTDMAGQTTFDVDARPLDDLLDESRLEVVDLLKMDIEGFEGFALEGLAKSLTERRVKSVLLELHPAQIAEHGQSAQRIVEQMRQYGYRPWKIDHSLATTRRVAYGGIIDLKAVIRPFDEGSSLDSWPHLLWTAQEVEQIW